MDSQSHSCRKVRPAFCWAMSLSFLIALAMCCSIPLPTSAQDQKSAGVTIAGDADAKDLGLPLYPGSRRHKDKDSDSPGANFGLWGGGSGFKLAVLKMESDDPPDKIANYYKKALAKYGKVLDCSHPAPENPGAAKDDSSKTLTCADDKPEPGGMMFKAGTKEKQHIVGIQPNGGGTLYQLVYVASWSADDKKAQ
jgi:hypothetical protein